MLLSPEHCQCSTLLTYSLIFTTFFQQSLNSIVGPNGSGKSNVIDSMLFVFGYRAQKLRTAKISNLIHNSDTMPNCERAEVKVNFAIIDDKVCDVMF